MNAYSVQLQRSPTHFLLLPSAEMGPWGRYRIKEMIARLAVDTQHTFQLIDTDGDGSVSGGGRRSDEATEYFMK